MRQRLHLLTGTFFFASLCIAQEKPAQPYSWPDKVVYDILPDTFKNHRAVFISENREVNIKPVGNGYELMKEYTYQCKAKALVAGVVVFRFPSEPGETVDVLSARRVSKSGNTTPIMPHEIKKNGTKETDYYSGKNHTMYEVHGSQSEDEIEFICKTKKQDAGFSGEIYFSSYYPVIASSFTLKADKSLATETAAYNGLRNPVVSEKEKTISYFCTAGKLMPYTNEAYAIPSATLPYLRFAVSKQQINTSASTYGKAYQPLVDQADLMLQMKDLVISADKDGIIKKFLNERLINRTVINYYESLQAIHEYINNNVSIKELNTNDPEKTFSILLEQGYTDRKNLLLMYTVIFTELQTDFYIGFARDKYQGKYDHTFNALSQSNRVFFAFEMEGKIYFLFPKTENSAYHLGELPWELQGTEAFIVLNKNIPDRFKKIVFESYNIGINYFKNNSIVKTDLKKLSFAVSSKETYSGTISSKFRQRIQNLEKDNVMFEESSKKMQYENSSAVLDSVYIRKNSSSFPHIFQVNKKYRQTAGITKKNDSAYTVSPAGWFNQNILIPQVNSRKLDFYSPYTYSDNVKMYLTFESDVDIPNREKYAVELRNELGNYTFKISRINNRNYVIETNYEITKGMVPALSYAVLKDLYDAYKRGTNQKIVVKSAKY